MKVNDLKTEFNDHLAMFELQKYDLLKYTTLDSKNLRSFSWSILKYTIEQTHLGIITERNFYDHWPKLMIMNFAKIVYFTFYTKNWVYFLKMSVYFCILMFFNLWSYNFSHDRKHSVRIFNYQTRSFNLSHDRNFLVQIVFAQKGFYTLSTERIVSATIVYS